ncbi:hypothetical protein VWZ82_13040 [Phaeobacter sp. JH20_41]|uniref:hypothetical protein n=1 Tax=Phaeobacter sp. JH20_41 TaxID=3112498 RepID=UPI003A87BBE8
MAQLDTRLPLMAQQPDIVNALARSSAAAQQTNQVQGQNALRNLFQTQGADIAAGQPQALNALAQLDPMQAVQMQSARQDMQSRAQLMEQRRIAMGREAEAYAASLGAQERAQEAARVEQGVAQGMQFYQRGDLNGLNQLLGTVGEAPLQSLDEFPTVAAMYGDVLDKLKSVQELTAPPKPDYVVINKQLVDRNAPGGPAVVPVQGTGQPGAEVPDFETEQKLRKEFSGLPSVQDFSKVQDSYDRIGASAEDPSAAGDLALVFNYMKMLDPGSVVRESEFATAANAAGVPDRIRNAYNRVLSGERLATEQRKDFVDRAGRLFNSQAGNYNDRANQYRGLAEQYGLSPDRIAQVVDLYGVEPEAAAEALNAAGEGAGSGSGASYKFETDQQRQLFEKYGAPSE